MKDADVGLLGAMLLVCGGACLFVGLITRDLIWKDAIRAGVAEWVIVDENGRTEFRWKAPKVEQ